MGIWKPRFVSARATPEPAASVGPAAEGDGIDHTDHDHPDAHEAAALCAEHTAAEHADSWAQLHRG